MINNHLQYMFSTRSRLMFQFCYSSDSCLSLINHFWILPNSTHAFSKVWDLILLWLFASDLQYSCIGVSGFHWLYDFAEVLQCYLKLIDVSFLARFIYESSCIMMMWLAIIWIVIFSNFMMPSSKLTKIWMSSGLLFLTIYMCQASK